MDSPALKRGMGEILSTKEGKSPKRGQGITTKLKQKAQMVFLRRGDKGDIEEVGLRGVSGQGKKRESHGHD